MNPPPTNLNIFPMDQIKVSTVKVNSTPLPELVPRGSTLVILTIGDANIPLSSDQADMIGVSLIRQAHMARCLADGYAMTPIAEPETPPDTESAPG